MIEATGVLTLVADGRTGHVAVPDLVYGGEWAEPDSGLLYHKLLELIGQEVYVLVLPKAEMLAMCDCGHTKADHMEFNNWQRGRFSNTDPDFSPSRSHRSYYGNYPSDDVWCNCRQFTPKP